MAETINVTHEQVTLAASYLGKLDSISASAWMMNSLRVETKDVTGDPYDVHNLLAVSCMLSNIVDMANLADSHPYIALCRNIKDQIETFLSVEGAKVAKITKDTVVFAVVFSDGEEREFATLEEADEFKGRFGMKSRIVKRKSEILCRLK